MATQLTPHMVRDVFGLLTAADRRKLVIYVAGSFVMSLTEMLGLAVVLPLVQLMTGSPIEGYLATIHRLLGQPSRTRFIITLAGAMVVAFMLKALFGMGMYWWGTGFTTRLQLRLQRDLFESYITEPYTQHRRRNTSEVIRATGAASVDTFGKVLGGLLGLMTEGMSVLLVFGLLLAVLPIPTLIAVVYFTTAMFVVQRVLADENQRASSTFMGSSFDSAKTLLESFQGFREIRMQNKEELFTLRFHDANSRATQAARKIGFLSVVPKYLLEVITILGIAILMAALTAAQTPSLVASIALFVAAAIKMLPSITRLTSTVGVMRSGAAGAEITLETMRELESRRAAEVHRDAALPSPARGDITVQNVVFQFPDGNAPVLNGVDILIPHGSSVALCGSSGSGKTTLVDIILGLLEPDQGRVLFSGIDIADLRENWRKRIGYIPQDVYLLDDSLAENIAYGERGESRDDDRIQECIRLARLDSVVAAMPDGIHTQIGERGTRLSGGQRQRVGIARALYHQPSVIVMDEATSALDNETEDQIIQTIESLKGEMTTIMVAHRLSTVRNVDRLYFFENGQVSAQGTFEEVRAANARFAELVRLGNLSEARTAASEAAR